MAQWVDITTIDNVTPFTKVRWKGSAWKAADCWFSEASGLTTDNMVWTQGTAEYGWFSAHRMNGGNGYIYATPIYCCSFQHTGSGYWDDGGTIYQDHVKDVMVSLQGYYDTTVTINNETYYEIDFSLWSGASGVNLYMPFSDPTQIWNAGDVYVYAGSVNIQLDKNTSKFKATGGTDVITVTAQDDWTADVDSASTSWLSVDIASGTSGTSAVTLTALANSGSSARTGVVTFSCSGESVELTAKQSKPVPVGGVGNIFIGGNPAEGMYIGDTPVDAMYIGDALVFPTVTNTVLRYKAPAQVVPYRAYSDTAWTLTLISDDYDSATTVGTVTFSGAGLTIPRDAYKNCTAMTEFNMGKGVESIGDYAFSYCKGISALTINKGVKNIGTAPFEDCYGLTEVRLPSSVTGMTVNTFFNCTGLTSCNIPDTVVGPAGYHLDGCFQFCSSLTGFTIPSAMTVVGDAMFRQCRNLTNVDIPDGVTMIDREAFYGTSALTSVILPSGVTEIGAQAFYNDLAGAGQYGLNSIRFKGSTPPATVGTDAFYKVQSAGTIYCPSDAVSAYTAWLANQTGPITGWTVEAGGLPNKPFMFNYNAKQFDSVNQTFPKTTGQLFDEDLVLTGTTVNSDANSVDFRNKTAAMCKVYNDSASNPFNRYASATTFTMVYRVKYFTGSQANLFANRGNAFNYMVRGTVFHTADSNYLYMDPPSGSSYVMMVRVKSDGSAERSLLDLNGTVLDSVSASTITWGGDTDAIGFFSGYGTMLSEPFDAVFYWMYLSNEELTDLEVLDVIRYNEYL